MVVLRKYLEMRVANLNQPLPSVNETGNLLDRLQQALLTSKAPVQSWLITQIEATLAEIPFKESSMRPSLAPVRDTTPNRLLNPQEAAKLLNIPVRWLYRHSKKLPCRRLGKHLRFPERELIKWAERQQITGN